MIELELPTRRPRGERSPEALGRQPGGCEFFGGDADEAMTASVASAVCSRRSHLSVAAVAGRTGKKQGKKRLCHAQRLPKPCHSRAA